MNDQQRRDEGALGLVSQHVVNLWFVRHRRLNLGITGLGSALANGVVQPLIQALIAAQGWRNAYTLLGDLVALTIALARPSTAGDRNDAVYHL